MGKMKERFKISLDYLKTLVKWLLVATLIGVAGGLIGNLFHKSVEYVTELREEHSFLLYFLPLGGIIIAFIYKLCKRWGKIDTNRVLEAARDDEKVPLVMAPLIFVSTTITHLLGGSAGREGAALQLGGSIGYNMGRVFKLNKNDNHIIVMAGMGSVFSALFGTPLTAAFFALEVTRVGVMHYAALVPCLLSSVVAYYVSLKMGAAYDVFSNISTYSVDITLMLRVIILALLCALVSILFCASIKKCEKCMDRFLKNPYFRAFVGGTVIVLLTKVLGTTDYNGAGMGVITRTLTKGEVVPVAFLLKIVFTAITIAAGFKGGEIVPSFFIGSTFGCFAGGLLGMDPSFGAAIGFVTLFCGVVNCPVASVMLAFEMFGNGNILFFAVACGVSFMMSGYFGLYKSQKIAYSKLNEDYIDRNTR